MIFPSEVSRMALLPRLRSIDISRGRRMNSRPQPMAAALHESRMSWTTIPAANSYSTHRTTPETNYYRTTKNGKIGIDSPSVRVTISIRSESFRSTAGSTISTGFTSVPTTRIIIRDRREECFRPMPRFTGKAFVGGGQYRETRHDICSPRAAMMGLQNATRVLVEEHSSRPAVSAAR